MPRYTVVGGGIAGLVVARRLAMAGHPVSLLEASDRLGGTLARHIVGGIGLDAGAESFATRGGVVETLARELGLGDQVVAPTAGPAWLQPAAGPAAPLPETGLLGIPGTPLAPDVVATVGLGSALRAQLDAVIPSFRLREGLSLGRLVRRRMGRGVLRKLVAPVVQGVYSMHPDELALDRVGGLRAAMARHGSLAASVRSLRAAAPAGAAVRGIIGGVNRIAGVLAADLESLGVRVELGRRVDAIEGLAGTVVVAAPGVVSPVSWRDVVLATLVVEQPELDAAPRGTGVLVAPGAAGIRARALTHATAKWDWLRERAGGRHVLRLSYDEEPADLADAARADAAALLGVPLPGSSVVDVARVGWRRPITAPSPTGIPVAGEAAGVTGLAGIIRQANAVADQLLA